MGVRQGVMEITYLKKMWVKLVNNSCTNAFIAFKTYANAFERTPEKIEILGFLKKLQKTAFRQWYKAIIFKLYATANADVCL